MNIGSANNHNNFYYNKSIKNVLNNFKNYTAKGNSLVDPPPSLWVMDSAKSPVLAYDAKSGAYFNDGNTSASIKVSAPNNNFCIRLDSYIYLDPATGIYEKASFDQVNQERTSAVADFCQKNGISNYTTMFSEEGATITIGGAPDANGNINPNLTIISVSWKDISLESKFIHKDDGYIFLNDPIFGEIKINDGDNIVDFAAMRAVQGDLQAKTAYWYAVNGSPPNTYQSTYKADDYTKTYLYNPDFTSYQSPGTSTSDAVNKFIAQYYVLLSQKKELITELQNYYSPDKIMERIKNTGISDKSEVSNILKAQLEFGADSVYTIRTRGDVNMDETMEQSVKNFLLSHINQTGIANIFGTESNELATSLAKTALGENVPIKLGDSEVTYKQYLDIEKTLNTIYNNLDSIIYNTNGSKSLGNSDDNVQTIKNVLNQNNKLIDSMSGQYDDNIINIIKSWNEQATNNFIGTYDSLLQQGFTKMGISFTHTDTLQYRLQ